MGITFLKIHYHLTAYLKLFLYKFLFGKNFSVGKNTTFRKYFNVYLDKGATISIGKNCFFNNGCSLNALESIKIGDGCLFGENVKIYDHNHRFSKVETPIKEQGFTTGAVTIGKQCWFGSNVIILKGVHIGNNCVVGAGAVIDCDIPDGTLVKSDRTLTFQNINFK